MDIDGIDVRTPYDLDSFLEYDYAWMHKVARCIADKPEVEAYMPDAIRNNPIVASHVTFLAEYRIADDATHRSPEFQAHRIALGWHDSGALNQVRFFLEALLLTGASYSTIAQDLGGSALNPDVIRLYERLYFNVRESDGGMARSSYIRMRAANPPNLPLNATTPQDVVWKNIAMRYGYPGLVLFWQMPNPSGDPLDDNLIVEECHRAAQGIQMENFARRTVNNFDLGASMGHYVEYKRMRHDTGGQTMNKSDALMIDFLTRFAPTMLAAANDVDRNAETTKQIQSRLKAQISISNQAIEDKGRVAGLIGLNKSMDQAFKNAGYKKE